MPVTSHCCSKPRAAVCYCCWVEFIYQHCCFCGGRSRNLRKIRCIFPLLFPPSSTVSSSHSLSFHSWPILFQPFSLPCRETVPNKFSCVFGRALHISCPSGVRCKHFSRTWIWCKVFGFFLCPYLSWDSVRVGCGVPLLESACDSCYSLFCWKLSLHSAWSEFISESVIIVSL